MTTEVQTPNKKMKMNEDGCENFKDDAYKEILQVEISRREKAEAEVTALNHRIQLLEDDLMRAEERCATATQKLMEASKPTGKLISKELEKKTNKENSQEEEDLAKKIQELINVPVGLFRTQAKSIAEEVNKKNETAAKKLALVKVDLERAEEKAKNSESKIVELENELKVVSKSLQMSVIQLKEDPDAEPITFSNMEAETRAQFAERNAEKLQTEVDRLKDELQAEQERNKNLQEEMEATLQDIQNM